MKTDKSEIEFAEGFNWGYWLYSYEPQVAQSLNRNIVVEFDDFSTGFSSGLKQAEQEQTIKEFKSQQHNDVNNDIER